MSAPLTMRRLLSWVSADPTEVDYDLWRAQSILLGAAESLRDGDVALARQQIAWVTAGLQAAREAIDPDGPTMCEARASLADALGRPVVGPRWLVDGVHPFGHPDPVV